MNTEIFGKKHPFRGKKRKNQSETLLEEKLSALLYLQQEFNDLR